MYNYNKMLLGTLLVPNTSASVQTLLAAEAHLVGQNYNNLYIHM